MMVEMVKRAIGFKIGGTFRIIFHPCLDSYLFALIEYLLSFIVLSLEMVKTHEGLTEQI